MPSPFTPRDPQRRHHPPEVEAHPAWRSATGALVCPICYGHHHTIGDYDRDILGHDGGDGHDALDAETAVIWLSARTYRRVRAERGWPVQEAAA